MSGAISGISSMAVCGVLADLAQAYARRSAQRVSVVSAGGVDVARRVEAGESFDFVALSADAIARLATSGRVLGDSRVDFVHSDVAVAVAHGARRPPIGDEAAVRAAVLAARTIGYSTGPSGAHLMQLFERWGIADVVRPRIVQAKPGVPVGTLVVRGEVELAFQQLSELINLPGVDVIGVLPAEIRVVTVFCAAVCTASAQPRLARDFLRFLVSGEADAAKQQHGMRSSSESTPPAQAAASGHR